MHGEYHGGGRAGATKRVANVGNVEDRGFLAAELARNLDSKKPLLTRGIDGRFWKSGCAIDIIGLGRSHRRHTRSPLYQGGASLEKLLTGFTRGEFAEPGFLHIHDRYDLQDCRFETSARASRARVTSTASWFRSR